VACRGGGDRKDEIAIEAPARGGGKDGGSEHKTKTTI
jgi:hypothetical protein